SGYSNSPDAALVQGSDGRFYGTTPGGGAFGAGTIFAIDAAGTFTTLHSFSFGIDGGGAFSALVQGSDGRFYGTTVRGGASGYGTVFAIDATGTLTTFYSFTSYFGFGSD